MDNQLDIGQLDVGRFNGLLEESADLHADAMRTASEPLDAVVEIGRERRATPEYREIVREERVARESVNKALVGAGLAAGGALALGAFATPAFAQANSDIAMLQTAASLENLAVFSYNAALGFDYLKNPSATAFKTVRAFAEMTKAQHTDHAKAFNSKISELGGKQQTATNPKYTPVVQQAVPSISKDPKALVKLAMTLEDVATSTYVKNIQDPNIDPKVRLLFGTIAGVESQHLAILIAVGALLGAGATDLITVKATGGAVNLAKLPAIAGSAPIPETFKKTDLASPSTEGAVK